MVASRFSRRFITNNLSTKSLTLPLRFAFSPFTRFHVVHCFPLSFFSSCTLSRLLSSYLFLSLLPSFSLLFYFVCAHCHFISLLSCGSLFVSVWCQDAMSCLCVGVKSVHVSPYYKFWCLVLFAPRRIDHDVRNSCLSGSRNAVGEEAQDSHLTVRDQARSHAQGEHGQQAELSGEQTAARSHVRR